MKLCIKLNLRKFTKDYETYLIISTCIKITIKLKKDDLIYKKIEKESFIMNPISLRK